MLADHEPGNEGARIGMDRVNGEDGGISSIPNRKAQDRGTSKVREAPQIFSHTSANEIGPYEVHFECAHPPRPTLHHEQACLPNPNPRSISMGLSLSLLHGRDCLTRPWALGCGTRVKHQEERDQGCDWRRTRRLHHPPFFSSTRLLHGKTTIFWDGLLSVLGPW